MCKSCAGQICEHNSQWWQIKAGSCCKRRPVVVGAGAGRIYKCLQEVSNLRLQRPSQKMECKECCMSAILTLLLLLHLSIQTGGQSQTPGQNYAQNTIQNASYGSGRQRGSGRSSGSGSTGTLPPCRECFGHGSNPNSDPRCRLGCRGADDNAQITPLPNIMHPHCSEGGSCRHDAALDNASHHGSSSRKLKNGVIIGAIVLCILIVVVVVVKRHKLSSVGVIEKHDVTNLNNVQTI